MKRKLLISLQEKISTASKKPWACFETTGPNEEGRLPFTVSYNKAFVNNLKAQGYEGMTDEEIVQMFFISTRMLPESMVNEEDTVNPEEMPNLSREANSFRR